MSIRLRVKSRIRHLLYFLMKLTRLKKRIKQGHFIKLSFGGQISCENLMILPWECLPEELNNSSCNMGHLLLPSSALSSEISEMKAFFWPDLAQS